MKDMKFVVLIWLVFHLFPFTTSNTNSATESYTRVNTTNLAKPGCNSTCGDLIVPYPFGIGDNPECYVNEGFRIYCNTSVNPPKATITRSNDYSSIKLISDSTIRVSSIVASRCYIQNRTIYNNEVFMNYKDRPYTFSKVNKFTVIGCYDSAWLTAETKSKNMSTGCMVYCSTPKEVVGDECTGNGCCQSTIPRDINYYSTRVRSLLDSNDNVSYIRSFDPCAYAFVGEENVFNFNGVADLNDTSFIERTEARVPIVLEWAIGNLSCSEAEAMDGFACQPNSKCVNSTRETGGYRCVCNEGYEGNPYLSPGCQDINECEDPRNYPCYGICTNTLGGYNCNCQQGAIGDAKKPGNCSCPPGYSGDPNIKNGCEAAKDSKVFSNEVIIATVIGLIAIVCATMMGIFFSLRRRKQMRLREKFFEQNGGALLKQKINSQGTHATMTLFSSTQLQKATNNYSQEQIVGRGGYGVVYKVVLSDNRVVAIKKSKIVDGSQAEQFINEVLILTQVIHRNVVKLLGCCLEEVVPVLVYEFISNNTLYHHIHHKLGGMNWLSWENRLRIAAEAAGALAYLHSETIMPIIHRDVKSANILLDDNYTVKVSDFGESRLVPLDHEQVTTMIQGTLGYLDPQYYHTSQLTEKSDVYSFGVVLAELITGKIPIGADRVNEEKNLATYFVNSVKENRLFQIVEPRLLREGTLDKLHTLANLVKRCLSLQSHDRPTMKEVAMELDGLRKFTTHPWIPETSQETRSLVLEVEQSDLYDAPLVSYGPIESDSYFVSRNMAFEENEPR